MTKRNIPENLRKKIQRRMEQRADLSRILAAARNHAPDTFTEAVFGPMMQRGTWHDLTDEQRKLIRDNLPPNWNWLRKMGWHPDG